VTGQSGSGRESRDARTILDIIRLTTDYLSQKGVETPRLDAEVLLADLLGLNRVDLYVQYDRPMTPAEINDYRDRVRRRAAREPAAYIIGRREFYSLDIHVSPDVLIPRPETELLVDEALDAARKRHSSSDGLLQIADIGTGSGAIALALASELGARARIHAVDISPAALDVARLNAERLRLSEKILFYEGDLTAPLTGLRFQLILANLPYIPRDAFHAMVPEVSRYEPHLALDGGEDGLELIQRLVVDAAPLLEPDGALLLEIWPSHGPDLRKLGVEHGFDRVVIRTDFAGRDRVAVLNLSGT
jgi:release factor glutamine methyltransferase